MATPRQSERPTVGRELTPETRFTSPGFLLNKVGTVAAEWIREALLDVGITPRQGGVLLALRAHGPLGQGALGQLLDFDPSTLVLLLNDLEEQRLVERRRDPEDRRRHIVQITRKGLRRREAADAAVGRVEERLLSGLEQDEREVLRGLLLRVDERTAPDWAPDGA